MLIGKVCSKDMAKDENCSVRIRKIIAMSGVDEGVFSKQIAKNSNDQSFSRLLYIFIDI